MLILKHALFLLLLLILSGCSDDQKKTHTDTESVTLNNSEIERTDNAITITAQDGRTLRVSVYGDAMLRMQSVRKGEAFYPNDHYEMVASHQWPSVFETVEKPGYITLKTRAISVEVNTDSLAAKFFHNDDPTPYLSEKHAVQWTGNSIKASFISDPSEHFTGLGHGYYAREKSLDLKGKTIHRNYGKIPTEQAPLLVPFFMSSKGYGIFMNSTFTNTFTFSDNGEYSMAIDDLGFDGRMDYFFIGGKKLTTVLDNYTQLTGRPRLPAKAMFGLQLSDKGHDHNSSTPSDEKWWKQKITQHRSAGFPLDHVVNDNRWRAAGGKRCESKLDWDPERYPNPQAYGQWLEENGLVVTLDFNRCIGRFTDGWKAEFNLPETGEIEFPESAPDLTNAQFRRWFWQAFETKALIPEKDYPGDALWIDEFDEQGGAPKDMVLANGRSSGEMRNYWFFMIAKALVEEGWDTSTIDKRPFVWVRGMTAGAQRYATLWSGDIYPNYSDMKDSIRGMQLAGLSGFPYWGHDAGGFFNWDDEHGPDENLYKRWAMAFGAFAPIWKPHGMGESRWPLDRDNSSQTAAHKFSTLRYTLMPYLYSAAQASNTGLPIARAMVLDHQHEDLAWQYDLQYMWGDALLVAPQTQDAGTMKVWLPKGNWYAFGSPDKLSGGRELTLTPGISELPIYAKSGAIIPTRDYALSTAFIDKSKLGLLIYAGADGDYTLIEDDDRTEAYRKKKEIASTNIRYQQNTKTIIIDAMQGTYVGATDKRRYTITIYGLSDISRATVNGVITPVTSDAGTTQIDIPSTSTETTLEIQLLK